MPPKMHYVLLIESVASMAVRHQDETLLELERVKAPPPPLYRVLLLNDDFTPMEFVIEV